MLDHDKYTLALRALYNVGAYCARKQRIFAVVLEVTSGELRAMGVGAGSIPTVVAALYAVVSDRLTGPSVFCGIFAFAAPNTFVADGFTHL